VGLSSLGLSDSTMDKIAFDNPYRLPPQNIPWRRDHIGRERPARRTALDLVTQKNDASPEETRSKDCSSSLAN